MKGRIAAMIVAGLVLFGVVGGSLPVRAAKVPPPHHYRNCVALRTVFRHGVAKSSSAANRQENSASSSDRS